MGRLAARMPAATAAMRMFDAEHGVCNLFSSFRAVRISSRTLLATDAQKAFCRHRSNSLCAGACQLHAQSYIQPAAETACLSSMQVPLTAWPPRHAHHDVGAVAALQCWGSLTFVSIAPYKEYPLSIPAGTGLFQP